MQDYLKAVYDLSDRAGLSLQSVKNKRPSAER